MNNDSSIITNTPHHHKLLIIEEAGCDYLETLFSSSYVFIQLELF